MSTERRMPQVLSTREIKRIKHSRAWSDNRAAHRSNSDFCIWLFFPSSPSHLLPRDWWSRYSDVHVGCITHPRVFGNLFRRRFEASRSPFAVRTWHGPKIFIFIVRPITVKRGREREDEGEIQMRRKIEREKEKKGSWQDFKNDGRTSLILEATDTCVYFEDDEKIRIAWRQHLRVSLKRAENGIYMFLINVVMHPNWIENWVTEKRECQCSSFRK